MKTPVYLTLIGLVALVFLSCARVTPQPTESMLVPGDKIGNMTLEKGSIDTSYPFIWDFCKELSDGTKPGIQTTDCEVPLIPGMSVNIGWYARDTMLASNWEAMTWDLYIDGYKIDLESFGWIEYDMPGLGGNVRARSWFINLTNPSPGQHKVRFLWTTKKPIDDGFDVYSPGTYEHQVNFTVRGDSDQTTTFIPLPTLGCMGFSLNYW